jgi:hypothetical protein
MKSMCAILLVLLLSGLSAAQPAAHIVSLQGSVQIRRGLDEAWQLAAAGMPLEVIDTILTGERSQVILKTADGASLKLGANIILDIADVRRLSEQEMFLWLMSQKIDQLPPRQEKTPLRFGQITSVHGEEKGRQTPASGDRFPRWRAQVNGALALLENDYRTNAVVTCHKILRRFPEQPDCGEVHFYLGSALESLSQNGQAVEAYQTAHERMQAGGCTDPAVSNRRQAIADALERLRSEKP